MTNLFVRSLAFILLTSPSSIAQAEFGQALPNLLRGNEQFGRKLLPLVHSSTPNRNVVISPLSLTLVFAALQANSEGGPARAEIGDAIGWGEYPNLSVPARMLLAAFEKPERVSPPSKQKRRGSNLESFAPRSREGAWITNTLLYRGKDTLSAGFIKNAQKYYGVNFRSTREARPTAANLKSTGHSGRVLPMISADDDVLISSASHLQTAWSGNTFSMSVPHIADFRTASGELKQVEMLDSELETYLYAKTDTFEAVALPCNSAYMIAVLPAPGQSVHGLERLIAETPSSIDSALKKQVGLITMPTFHFQFETNLRQPVEEMGIRTPFENLGSIFKIPKSHLTQISQKTDVHVNEEGIQADAELVVGAVYGGIVSAQKAFHMELNRPFVFLIRDRATNALLFIGATADPTQP